MTDFLQPGRRIIPVLAAAGVLAVLVIGVLLARGGPDQPGPFAVAPLPPASPGVVSAGFVGSRWRLTAVADRRGTTEIPVSIDAWVELAADGEIIASDDINTLTGHFTTTGVGFDVTDTVSTLAGYGGTDPAQVAAIAGIDAVTFGLPAVSSSVSEAQVLHVTVLSADREHLTVQAGGVRLTFVRSGPAGPRDPQPVPPPSA